MSALHHLTGRVYWDEHTGGVLERDDSRGVKVRELFGRYMVRAHVPHLDAAWDWVCASEAELATHCCACDSELSESGECDECLRAARQDERDDFAYEAWRDRQGELFA